MTTPAPRRLWLHALLFAATVASTFGTLLASGGGALSPDFADQAEGAALFSLTAMLILTAHEMGHYLMARAHGVEVSLPYFIPLPLLGFGTMGAVIRLKGRVPNRNALVDIGAAGPLAGLAIAIPMMVAGMVLSHVAPAPPVAEPFPPHFSLWSIAAQLGDSIGRWLFHKPQLAPSILGVQIFGDNLFTLAAQRLVHGPLTATQEVYAHPVFIAAWFGMLVTMLNLLPVGQLYGGHLTHAWFGEKAETYGHHVVAAVLVLALFFSASWVVWAVVVTKVVGFKHPPVVDEVVPLSWGRKMVCVVSLVCLALTLMPMPLGVV